MSCRAVFLCSLISLARLPAPLTFLHGFRPMISVTTAQSIIPEKNENRWRRVRADSSRSRSIHKSHCSTSATFRDTIERALKNGSMVVLRMDRYCFWVLFSSFL